MSEIEIDMGGVCSELCFSEGELIIIVDSEADVSVEQALYEFISNCKASVKKIHLELPSDYSVVSFPESLSSDLEEIFIFGGSQLVHASVRTMLRRAGNLKSINISGAFSIKDLYLDSVESLIIRRSCYEELNLEGFSRLNYLGLEIDYKEKTHPVIVSRSLKTLSIGSDKKWVLDMDKVHLPQLKKIIITNIKDVRGDFEVLQNVSVTCQMVTSEVKAKLCME